jgi:hypothetical protein
MKQSLDQLRSLPDTCSSTIPLLTLLALARMKTRIAPGKKRRATVHARRLFSVQNMNGA